MASHPNKEMNKFARNWVLSFIGIYVFALLIGQEIDPLWYFGGFVGVPFATFYALYAYEKLKSRRR